MIKPTVGRVVLYWPQKPIEQPRRDQPYAATIAYVWGDRLVNLSYVDHNGSHGNATSVTLLQDDDEPYPCDRCAEWMPFQKGQSPNADTKGLRGSVDRALDKAAPRESGATSGMKRLRIVNDGLSNITKVYDFDSGEEVKLVQSLRLEQHVGGGMYARVETLARVPSLDLTVDAEVRGVVPGVTPPAGPVWKPSTFRGAAESLLKEEGGEAALEREIQSMTAPRVTPAQIDALMARVEYSFDVCPHGSTLTFAHAFLDGTFWLATGRSACVSPKVYDEEKGRELAQQAAERAARDALWDYEGYVLRDRLNRAPIELKMPGHYTEADLAEFKRQWELAASAMRGGDVRITGDGAVHVSGSRVTITGDVQVSGDLTGS